MLELSVRAQQVFVCQRCSFKKYPALINAVEHNSHFLLPSPWFSFELADINECSMPNKCQNGKCVNTEGSYTCECYGGFAKSRRGLCEGDMHTHNKHLGTHTVLRFIWEHGARPTVNV